MFRIEHLENFSDSFGGKTNEETCRFLTNFQLRFSLPFVIQCSLVEVSEWTDCKYPCCSHIYKIALFVLSYRKRVPLSQWMSPSQFPPPPGSLCVLCVCFVYANNQPIEPPTTGTHTTDNVPPPPPVYHPKDTAAFVTFTSELERGWESGWEAVRDSGNESGIGENHFT